MTQTDKDNGCNGVEEHGGRLQVLYENKSQRFALPMQHDYNRQFYNLYVARCEAMQGPLRERVAAKWGTKYPIRKIQDLNEEDQEKCVIIGTIFKQQALKPSVLKELSKVTHIMPQPIAPSFSDDSDVAMMEDEMQRVRLFGNFNVHDMVTGVMCAALGVTSHILEQGRFHVDEVVFHNCGPQKPLKSLDSSPLIVLISGLNMTHAENLTLPLEIMQQWIYGNLSDYDSKEFDASSLVRVIVAGNSVKLEDDRVESIDMEQQATDEDIDGIKCFDKFIHELSQSINVDIMPGEYDPTSSLLPQPPIHSLLLPQCGELMSCQSVTNPYGCEIAGRVILGMSGQNIDDILRYSRIPDALSALKATLRWGHLVPTCPDTKFGYPMQERDPFVIDECPHIYFAGNCSKYESELLEDDGRRIRLICVPKFFETKSVVVINLATLDTKLVTFQTQ